MWDFAIGLSGLDAARRGFDVIGNNIANAATEGYHRQRLDLAPAYGWQEGELIFGGGVQVEGVIRIIDTLLEQEILRQQSYLSQVSEEWTALRSIEAQFGDLSGGTGLNAAIDEFFGALSELGAHPGEIIWQDQVVMAGESMASRFRNLGQSLSDIQTQIRMEVENAVETVNTLTAQIAELNDNIQRVEVGGPKANNLRDQRDQLIKQLSELVSVQTQERDFGVVDVVAGGIPVVMGNSTIELGVGLNDNGLLGVTPAGAYNYYTSIQGGRINGLLVLANTTVANIQSDLDLLAQAIIQEINEYHVQGVGSAGSFTQLAGWGMASDDLDDISSVTAGTIYIRVTDTSTGAVSRTAISVDPSNSSYDQLSEIAAYITSNVTGVTASVDSSNRLMIDAETNYTFDFLPAVLPTPTATDFNGGSPPSVSVSGIYSGAENQTFTFTVLGSGSVGNGTLQLQVTDGSGQPVTTLNVGSGYAAGDVFELDNGIRISLGTGDLVAGDSFEVDAFAGSDTSGLLAAAGINTFFSGTDASDIAVCSRIAESPACVAASLGPDMTDNANAIRLAGIQDQAIAALDSLTAGEFYRRLVTDIGQQVAVRQMQQDNIEVVVQNLTNQQSEISGVDINEEAAKMLIFEQMFQAMAKYMSTVQTSISTLMDLV